MKVEKRVKDEFFGSEITIFYTSKKEPIKTINQLRLLGFRDIQSIPILNELFTPRIALYHQRDYITGPRIDYFTNYSQELRNVA